MGVSRSDMKPHYDPDRHHRRSIRLRGYDYSQEGLYFVTICVQDRLCLFGEAGAGAMRLNDAGQMLQAAWDEMPHHYPGVDIDVFAVMPNHIHSIVVLTAPPPTDVPTGRDRNVDVIVAAPADPDVDVVGPVPARRTRTPHHPRHRGNRVHPHRRNPPIRDTPPPWGNHGGSPLPAPGCRCRTWCTGSKP